MTENKIFVDLYKKDKVDEENDEERDEGDTEQR